MDIQVAFIKQEAVEKAREIQIKADEEFAIEKAKIVRQEAINIDSQYDKKIKQAEVSQRCESSLSQCLSSCQHSHPLRMNVPTVPSRTRPTSRV